MAEVERLLSVEENDDVAKTMVGDMMEDLADENLTDATDVFSDDDVNEVEQGEANQSSGAANPPPPPPHRGVAEPTRENRRGVRHVRRVL